ncbi:MAG: MTH938/NDUFAF3 family protein [Candidatus Hodarchaeales archaeon]
MNIITNYEFGKIKINDLTYTSDLILTRTEIISNWWRIEGHNLHMDDLQEIIKRKSNIDLLIIGNGKSGVMKVPQVVIDHLEKLGIKTIVKKTKEAVNEYNKLIHEENKRIAAAFHLAC